jgi:translation initiation factor IF-2
MADTSKLLQDKRVVIGGALGLVALIGGATAAYFSGALGGGTDDAATDTTVASAPVSPAGGPGSPAGSGPVTPAPAGVTGRPGGPAPGRPTTPAPRVRVAAAPPVPRRLDDRSSWADAPLSYPGGGGGAPGQPPAPVPAPPPTTPNTGKTGDAAAVNAAKAPLKPIAAGVRAPGFRKDPFVSYRSIIPERTPAYEFLAPLRVAAQPQPPRPKPDADPYIAFGPLPFVPRRVAGILNNGMVSAILETNGADTRVVSPGDRVPSGIAGIDELTVSSITTTQVTLRAEDGRTVSVPLTGSPTAAAAQQGAGGGGGAPRGGAMGRGGGGGGTAELGN